MIELHVDKLVYGLDEVAERLSIGLTLTNQLVREGRIRGVKIGHRRLVARADLEAEAGHSAWQITDWAGTSERMNTEVYRHKLSSIAPLGPVQAKRSGEQG